MGRGLSELQKRILFWARCASDRFGGPLGWLARGRMDRAASQLLDRVGLEV